MAILKMADIVVGKKYKMKNDHLLNYGIGKGSTVTVVYKQGSAIHINSESYSSNLSVPLAALENFAITKKEIEALISGYEKTIQVQKDRLAWMVETGAEVYDEDEFKVWQVLSTLDDKKMSKIDRAKAIAKLVKG